MPNEVQKNVGKKKVLPGLEPGLQGSKPWVLTNYTIEPIYQSSKQNKQKRIFGPRFELGTFSVLD